MFWHPRNLDLISPVYRFSFPWSVSEALRLNIRAAVMGITTEIISRLFVFGVCKGHSQTSAMPNQPHPQTGVEEAGSELLHSPV